MPLSFSDPRTHYAIESSDTPVTVDGYALGEPKQLVCEECDASVLLTRDPSDPGIDELSHAADCSQRWVRSEWWVQQMKRS